MKISKNLYFSEEDIFSLYDAEVKKYPYWYQERLLILFQVLIERMEESELIQLSDGSSSENRRYHLMILEGIEDGKIYKELAIDFFQEFIKLEIVLRKFSEDFFDKSKKKFALNQIADELFRKNVLDGDTNKSIKKAACLRNKIAHGESLESSEIKIIESTSIENLIANIYSQYTYQWASGLYEDRVLKKRMIDMKLIDVLIGQEDQPDVLFNIQVVEDSKSYIGVNNFQSNLLKEYNIKTDKKNVMITLVYFKAELDENLRLEPPFIDHSKTIKEDNIYVLSVPNINTSFLIKLSKSIISESLKNEIN